jgi:hypothetical protein
MRNSKSIYNLRNLKKDSNIQTKTQTIVEKTINYNNNLKNNIWFKLNQESSETLRDTSKTSNKFEFLSEKDGIWLSPTNLNNYLLKNSLVDYFNYYHKNKNFNNNTNNNVLFELGNKFENLIFDKITEIFGQDNIKMVCKNKDDYYKRDKFEETKQYINNGVPIILQAMLTNHNNYTYGVADIIIRSDYINKLVKTPVLSIKEEKIKASKLNKNYHYLIIDVKYSNITLYADEISIKNDGRQVAYKGQLAIYNLALGEYQGYIPPKSYILSKSWESTYNKCNDSFNKLSEVNFEKKDNFILEEVINALKWNRLMRKEGKNWDLFKPHIPELYPNMNIIDDGWYDKKKEIADKISELTSIAYVGYKNRIIGHSNNIYDWKDKNCEAGLLGIYGKVISRRVNKIIITNRDNQNIISPNKILNNIDNWKEKNNIEFYLDFENVNQVFIDKNIDINNTKTNNIVFMIGVGYKNYINDEYIYKNFSIKEISLEEEQKMFDNFIKYILEITDKPVFVHWSSAEISLLNIINQRYNINNFLNKSKFIDLYKVFVEEPITIKDSLTYKLKDISHAMNKHNLITTNWDNTDIKDGFQVINEASNNYHKSLDNIIRYNEDDCKVLYKIISYLRNNLI